MENPNVYDVLKERGFIQQVTNEEEIREVFGTTKVTCYVGFDPTADSLHAGSLLPIMALVHLQRHGHHPIVVLGGGTTMVGDPSGKTEMRQMLLRETIVSNGEKIKYQLENYLEFKNGKASIIDNANWLLDLNYIDFLREIGCHFSVNRMLAAESYKARLETGLSFLEFNYQLLQAYDFLMLFRSNHCILQLGGDDQWGNIIAGIDLIRRLESKKAYGITMPLLETATGQKMGKTAKGALWLDANKTSSYEYYQYWINVDDRDVAKFLAYFTLLPMAEIKHLSDLQGADIRKAKEVLAFETTKITHGEEKALQAQEASRSVFGGVDQDISSLPLSKIPRQNFESGITITDLLEKVGLVTSKSEARRLIEQGGCYINNTRVDDVAMILDRSNIVDNGIVLRAGKKRYHRVLLE